VLEVETSPDLVVFLVERPAGHEESNGHAGNLRKGRASRNGAAVRLDHP
jgi:hypothetical protein